MLPRKFLNVAARCLGLILWKVPLCALFSIAQKIPLVCACSLTNSQVYRFMVRKRNASRSISADAPRFAKFRPSGEVVIPFVRRTYPSCFLETLLRLVRHILFMILLDVGHMSRDFACFTQCGQYRSPFHTILSNQLVAASSLGNILISSRVIPSLWDFPLCGFLFPCCFLLKSY